MNFLIIGLGGIGQRYMRLLSKNFKNSRIFALRRNKNYYEIKDNLVINKNTNIIKKYKIKEISSLDQLSDIELNLAIITSPTSKHLDYLKKLIDLKVPVLVEKPISNDYSKAKKIINYAESVNSIIQTGYMLRFNPAVKKIKKLIDNNFLGKIHNITVDIFSFMPGWHPYENYENLYASKKKLGGGVMLTESHEIDLILWLFGMPKVAFSINSRTSNFKIDVEDTAASVLKYNTKEKNFLVTINQCFTSKFQKRSIKIYGQKGLLELDLIKNCIWYNKKNKRKKIFISKNLKRNDLFLSQINYFIKFINNKIDNNSKVLDTGLNTLFLINFLKKPNG